MKNNFELVSNGKGQNLRCPDGSLLFDKWYKKIKIADDYILVQNRNGWWNLANSDGELISSRWLLQIFQPVNGIRTVTAVLGYSNFVKSGKLLLDTWAYDVDMEWSEGCTSVQFEENGLWYFVKDDGTPLFKQGFSDAWNFTCGWAGIQFENGLFNYVNKNHKYMFHRPLFKITPFVQGINKAYVIFDKDGEGCWIDTTGKIVFAP